MSFFEVKIWSQIRSGFADKKKLVFRVILDLGNQGLYSTCTTGLLIMNFSTELFFLNYINFKLIMELMECYHCQKKSRWKIMSYRECGEKKPQHLKMLTTTKIIQSFRIYVCHIHKYTNMHTHTG